jgi:hypothetical protein
MLPKPPRIPTDARRNAERERLIAAIGAEEARTAAADQHALAQHARRWSEERARLIGPDALSRARAIVGRRPPPTTGDRDAMDRLRHEQHRFRLASGVDLEQLARLDRQRLEDFRKIAKVSDVAFPVIDWLTPVADEPILAPVYCSPPGSAAPSTFYAPYAWWERSSQSFQYDSGQLKANTSYLNGDAGHMGALVWGKNTNAGNGSVLLMSRENGMLLPYVTPKEGPIAITVELQCVFDEHRIWTYDEYGWSNCGIFTSERIHVGALWDWADNTPKGETVSGNLTPLFYTYGDGESYPGTSNRAPSGATASVTLFLEATFPAKTPLWLYAGLKVELSAVLDDVSANVWANSCWLVRSIQVKTL